MGLLPYLMRTQKGDNKKRALEASDPWRAQLSRKASLQARVARPVARRVRNTLPGRCSDFGAQHPCCTRSQWRHRAGISPGFPCSGRLLLAGEKYTMTHDGDDGAWSGTCRVRETPAERPSIRFERSFVRSFELRILDTRLPREDTDFEREAYRPRPIRRISEAAQPTRRPRAGRRRPQT